LSLSLAGEAPAATGGLAAHLVTPNNEARHELALGEEEIFDVTLATFYLVNEENPGSDHADDLPWEVEAAAVVAPVAQPRWGITKHGRRAATQICRNVLSNLRILRSARTFRRALSRGVARRDARHDRRLAHS
jgi:hypothetical protein